MPAVRDLRLGIVPYTALVQIDLDLSSWLGPQYNQVDRLLGDRPSIFDDRIRKKSKFMGEGLAKVFLRAPNHRITVQKVAETVSVLVTSGKTRNS